ncbi:DUF1643 domain-containing protein [Cupriavidus malaysiensis]|nr:DUF1643 domain-containing protein [Cupriavidus malaysiensis]
MLNASMADLKVDDPTITRCVQRAIAGKYGGAGGGQSVSPAID